jgi:hypothetical protein
MDRRQHAPNRQVDLDCPRVAITDIERGRRLNLKNTLGVLVGLGIGAALASAGTIDYTCAADIAGATCDYLNTNVAGAYSSTFSNVNASIYIQYGTTGLAATSSVSNDVPYSAYLAALTANTGMDALQASALASLDSNAGGPYGSGNVAITDALADALGLGGVAIGGLFGVTTTGAVCSFPSAGCFNAVVTVTNDPGTPLYYDNLGGPEPSDAYDFYGVVEHETDEVLGTASCIATTAASLSDGCSYPNEPSAVDLFRYSAPGTLVLDSSLSTTPGAYFSYDGGATNGANGFVYNTLDNGEDYADFLSTCPGGPFSIQDAEGCPGTDAGQTILNDGGAEINILNAEGFDLNPQVVSSTPEPGTIALFGLGLGMLAIYRRRRV